ncbi:DivIVA domain-containing protein [Candidatus Latescibacterota bacterium]
MIISPLDIRKHEFKKSMRGYDVDEVAAFLDMVSMEYENFVRENAVMTEKIRDYNLQLKKYHDIEGTLQETLLSAERAREETVNIAKKQAEVIIREAEVKAASIIEDGRRVFTELRNRLIELKIQKDSYLTKIKSLMLAQMEIFDNVSFPEEDKIEQISDIEIGNNNNSQDYGFSAPNGMEPGVMPDNDKY